MYLEHHLHGGQKYAPEKTALPKLGDRIGDVFKGIVDPDRSGLYVVSSNAGFQSSLLFWADARQTGVGLASPELFPWTLANAPCGWLARQFHITGPNATYTGRTEALLWALDQAEAHLVAGHVDTAVIVAVDFSQTPAQRTRFGALRLSLQHSPLRMERMPVTAGKQIRPARASTALFKVFDMLKKCPHATVSDGQSAWLIRRSAGPSGSLGISLPRRSL